MEALSIESLEQSILSGAAELSKMTKAAPLKTPEEIRSEWLQERVGKFTASEFHRLVTCPNKKELPVGAITYSTEKAVELLTEFFEDGYISAAMQWGIDNELNAVNAFEERTLLNVEYTGSNQKFLTLGSNIGGTPDGLIRNQSGIEIKCPNPLTHFKYMLIKNNNDLKKVKPEYYWQIQGLMMITGCKKWHFISYDPRYKKPEHKIHIVEINADMEEQSFLSKRLSMAIDLRDELLNTL